MAHCSGSLPLVKVFGDLIPSGPQQSLGSGQQEMSIVYSYHIIDISSLVELMSARDEEVAEANYLQISFPLS
jgi:hypothetical protein